MKIEEALTRFLHQDVIVYTVVQAEGIGTILSCTLEEIGDGWLRVTQDDKTESIVNIANVVRVREYPRNKNGKKKAIIF